MSTSGVFSSVLGQPGAVQTLRKAVVSGRIHHAYRFEGPSGVGKKRAALALAQSLLCTMNAGEGCGACAACTRCASVSPEPPEVPLHPDFLWVRRGLYTAPLVSSKEATGISVEQVRKVVLGRAGFGPHEGNALVILIEDAEELTISAANALLKTLEEPPPKVHFILHTSRPHRLLDTLRSRTLAVRFGPLPDDVVTRLLTERGLDARVAPLAEGRMDRALELADRDNAENTQRWIATFEHARTAPNMGPALELVKELPKDRHEVMAALRAYCLYLAGQVRDTSNEHFHHELARRYRQVDDALTGLEQNVNPSLTIEALLVELRDGAP